jgi:hypothetical protein
MSKHHALTTQKHRTKFTTVSNKQATPLQSDLKTHMDVWYPIMGNRIQLQHRHSRTIPIQSLKDHHQRTLVRAQCDLTARSTSPLCKARSAKPQHHLPTTIHKTPQQTGNETVLGTYL